MSRDYLAMHLDPFGNAVSQPKILDGSVQRSSGLRFRTTGNFQLDAGGLDTYIALLPGYSNSVCWKRPSDVAYLTPVVNSAHYDSQVNRSSLKQLRLVGAALKLSLMNSSDENEGYWEAFRMTVSPGDLLVNATTGAVSLQATALFPNMANYQSYQSGKLKDIHRFQFKLNSTSATHDFEYPAAATADTINGVDTQFDMIVIKINGRIDAVTPSVVMYDTVSMQEVIYVDSTAQARLATPCPVVRNMDLILDKTRYQLPAIQIA